VKPDFQPGKGLELSSLDETGEFSIRAYHPDGVLDKFHRLRANVSIRSAKKSNSANVL
jgi:hypothetical protein